MLDGCRPLHRRPARHWGLGHQGTPVRCGCMHRYRWQKVRFVRREEVRAPCPAVEQADIPVSGEVRVQAGAQGVASQPRPRVERGMVDGKAPRCACRLCACATAWPPTGPGEGAADAQ